MAADFQLLTLGHGTLSSDEFNALIQGAGIRRLVDVRSIPQSRRQPHFCQAEMRRWIPQESGSAYLWQPALGGFRKQHPESSNVALRHPAFRAYADFMESDEFIHALDALLALGAQRLTAIMCSETVWWRCHRRLISDAATLLRGVAVLHLMHDGKLRPHLPTTGVRVTTEGRLRYDRLFETEPPSNA